MTEHKGQSDPNEPPEDVASLYSWANLHGAKYRDFSASRAQTREKARQRVEQAMEQEHQRTQQPLEPKRGNGDTRQEEPSLQSAATQAPSYPPQPAQPAPPDRPGIDRQNLERANPDRPNLDRPHAEHPIREDLASALRGLAVPPSYRQPGHTPHAPMREEGYTPPRNAWSADPRLKTLAALPGSMPERPGTRQPSPASPPTPEDTLQGSRERLATRWFALRGIFEGNMPPAQAAPAPVTARAPVMAVFSLAGGVGKTSLVATLGRALSARGERVLLVDTAAYGLLPFFFGAARSAPRHAAHLQLRRLPAATRPSR